VTSITDFAARTKVRPDFGDMLQVRYLHTDGEEYDTWVSGEEVLQRLQSETAEERLRGLSRLDWQAIQAAKERLPDEGQKKLRRKLVDRFADEVEEAVGGNLIGDNLADAVRGRDSSADPEESEREKWRTYLENENFRARVLELAWIQLEGSFPDEQPVELDDWM
jgi:hypothetical protein